MLCLHDALGQSHTLNLVLSGSSQGMALGYGGNPYGPAGTGKTESVKALGQAMARQVRECATARFVVYCSSTFHAQERGRFKHIWSFGDPWKCAAFEFVPLGVDHRPGVVNQPIDKNQKQCCWTSEVSGNKKMHRAPRQHASHERV